MPLWKLRPESLKALNQACLTLTNLSGKWTKVKLFFIFSLLRKSIHHIGLALLHIELTCCNFTQSNKAALALEDFQGHKTHTWLKTMAQMQQSLEQDVKNLWLKFLIFPALAHQVCWESEVRVGIIVSDSFSVLHQGAIMKAEGSRPNIYSLVAQYGL